MKNDWEKITRSKDAYRSERRALPFADKLKIVERMRDRDLEIRRTRLICRDDRRPQ
jgi:hypothetical protein